MRSLAAARARGRHRLLGAALLERAGAVEHQAAGRRGGVGIHAEVAQPLELEALSGLGFRQLGRGKGALDDREALGVEVRQPVVLRRWREEGGESSVGEGSRSGRA